MSFLILKELLANSHIHREMASALRAAITSHIRVPVSQTIALNLSKISTFRSFSSHGDDHLDKNQVIDRVLDVVKSHPKIDPSKVISHIPPNFNCIYKFCSLIFILIVLAGF